LDSTPPPPVLRAGVREVEKTKRQGCHSTEVPPG
jgi:hypothetical protein